MLSFKAILLSLVFIQSTLNLQVDPATEVMEMDKKLNKLIMQNNASAAEAFYTDDFMLITSGGSIKTKKDMVSEIDSPNLIITTNETTKTQVRVHGNTAVLTGILVQRGSYQGKEFDVKLWVTDTWIKTDNGWKILSGHAGKTAASEM